MKLKYINRIKANISIYTSIKTSNILEGSYRSVYKGKSMNFENLREYVINDDVKDIDWKSSARSGSLYVKQFIAEKKHNILFVMDTGKKMMADTDSLECKKDIALYSMGTLGYIAIKNSDCIGMIYKNTNNITYKPFRFNLYNLEEYLCEYDKDFTNSEGDLNYILDYIHKHISKKMVIVIITDIAGIDSINSNILKNLKYQNDVLVINVSDNNMIGENIYDVFDERYIPSFLLNDNRLKLIEKNIKEKLVKDNIYKLKKCGVCMESISSLKDINYKIIHLLEENKYGNRN